MMNVKSQDALSGRDYSVVVKIGISPKSLAAGDLSSREVEPDRSIADLLSHHVGCDQSRKSGR